MGRRRLRCLFFAAALAGCGGGGDPAPPPTAQPEPIPALSAPVNLEQGMTFGVRRWQDADTASGGQGQDVQGERCWPIMFSEFHTHSHLTILDDGQHLTIPTNIGIVPQEDGGDDRCFYAVHTHDGAGILHVESPVEKTFTLGLQFAIWGQPLSMTDVAGITGKPVRIFIKDPNAELFEYTDDPDAILLLDQREITIQVGTPVATIPTYNWLF